MIRVPLERLQRLLELLDVLKREDTLLTGVSDRLFANRPVLDMAWLQHLLTTPEGVDRLESFRGKFSRMQDTFIAKALPALLHATFEPQGSAIDNLNRAEALGLVRNAQEWVEMRAMRNQLIHEYLPDPDIMLAALERARTFVPQLHDSLMSMKERALALKPAG